MISHPQPRVLTQVGRLTMIRVLIVDDRRSIRIGLRALFDAQPDIGVCGLASSGEAGLVLALTLDPDVVVMDLVMPGMGGVAATRAIKESRTDCRVLVLSWQWSSDQVEPALRAGASRFLHKSERPEMLLEAVRSVASEETGPVEVPGA